LYATWRLKKGLTLASIDQASGGFTTPKCFWALKSPTEVTPYSSGSSMKLHFIGLQFSHKDSQHTVELLNAKLCQIFSFSYNTNEDKNNKTLDVRNFYNSSDAKE
jgi:hypothetical protein